VRGYYNFCIGSCMRATLANSERARELARHFAECEIPDKLQLSMAAAATRDSRPPPAATLDRARALVLAYPSCFVAWSRTPTIETSADVRAVIHALRAYGGHRAWEAAQALVQCL
jgi:hypothetical protein